jgi:hypothetical protein
MPIRRSTKSEQIHHSTYTFEGPSPRDGGKEFLNEVFDWIRLERQPGTMTIAFGLGGAIRSLRFDQTESIPTPLPDEYPSDALIPPLVP